MAVNYLLQAYYWKGQNFPKSTSRLLNVLQRRICYYRFRWLPEHVLFHCSKCFQLRPLKRMVALVQIGHDCGSTLQDRLLHSMVEKAFQKKQLESSQSESTIEPTIRFESMASLSNYFQGFCYFRPRMTADVIKDKMKELRYLSSTEKGALTWLDPTDLACIVGFRACPDEEYENISVVAKGCFACVAGDRFRCRTRTVPPWKTKKREPSTVHATANKHTTPVHSGYSENKVLPLELLCPSDLKSSMGDDLLDIDFLPRRTIRRQKKSYFHHRADHRGRRTKRKNTASVKAVTKSIQAERLKKSFSCHPQICNPSSANQLV